MIDRSLAKETWLQGRAVVPGIAVGSLYFLSDTPCVVRKSEDPSSISPEGEVDKLRVKGFCREADLVNTHLEMTVDPLLSSEVEGVIRSQKKRADDAVSEVMERLRLEFEKIPDAFFRQRFEEIEGVCLRILSCLSSSIPQPHPIPDQSILFAKSISAPIVAEASMNGLSAIVTTSGGAMSHTAIVAKARGIPYVTDIQAMSLSDTCTGSQIIVDGLAGLVVVNPSPTTLRRYTLLKEAHEVNFQGDAGPSARGMTKDGTSITMMANVSGVQDVSSLGAYGLDGVGLYRTEYQILERKGFPNEQEQEETYAAMVKAADHKSVVIRVFDFGSDKDWDEVVGVLPDVRGGRRTIDLLLDRPQIFLAHLRAMIRSAAHGRLSILFPMIGSADELERCLALFRQAYETVHQECPVPLPRIGVMLEIPSLAFQIPLLAGKIDFVSIGTNDLIQYSLAVDRSNSAAFDPHLSYHAGLLRLLQFVVHESRRACLSLSVCGEMASDPMLIPFLVGLGITELSVAPRLAPMVRQILRAFSMEEARQIAHTVLSLKSPKETYDFLRDQYCKINSD